MVLFYSLLGTDPVISDGWISWGGKFMKFTHAIDFYYYMYLVYCYKWDSNFLSLNSITVHFMQENSYHMSCDNLQKFA